MSSDDDLDCRNHLRGREKPRCPASRRLLTAIEAEHFFDLERDFATEDGQPVICDRCHKEFCFDAEEEEWLPFMPYESQCPHCNLKIANELRAAFGLPPLE